MFSFFFCVCFSNSIFRLSSMILHSVAKIHTYKRSTYIYYIWSPPGSFFSHTKSSTAEMVLSTLFSIMKRAQNLFNWLSFDCRSGYSPKHKRADGRHMLRRKHSRYIRSWISFSFVLQSISCLVGICFSNKFQTNCLNGTTNARHSHLLKQSEMESLCYLRKRVQSLEQFNKLYLKRCKRPRNSIEKWKSLGQFFDLFECVRLSYLEFDKNAIGKFHFFEDCLFSPWSKWNMKHFHLASNLVKMYSFWTWIQLISWKQMKISLARQRGE